MSFVPISSHAASMDMARNPLPAWHAPCDAEKNAGADVRDNKAAAFGGGAIIGVLGGLIGLGGAEFRLPLLIGAFRFAALEAVIVNKATSLVVVASALPFRAAAVPLGDVAAHWPIVFNLLAGSLLGAWLGAGWATRLKSTTLYRVIALLLVGVAALLLFGHDQQGGGPALATGNLQLVAGVAAGFIIGVRPPEDLCFVGAQLGINREIATPSAASNRRRRRRAQLESLDLRSRRDNPRCV